MALISTFTAQNAFMRLPWAIASSFAVVNDRFLYARKRMPKREGFDKNAFFMAFIPTFTTQNAFMRLPWPRILPVMASEFDRLG